MEAGTTSAVEAAFETFQIEVDADPDLVAVARARRLIFRDAFLGEADVSEFVYSGSLARKTQRDPMNDVDVIVVYNAAHHPDWGVDGDGSAKAALEHTRGRVRELLSASPDGEDFVRLTRLQNHAVKCFIDDPEDPDAFTVDAMPALRLEDGVLLVPEKNSDCWIKTNPEYLISKVAERQEEWTQFVPTVRMIKHWSETAGSEMKSLVAEVLALNELPVEARRAVALKRFFQAASIAVLGAVEDPAELCGEIQPSLDRQAACALLDQAASHAWKAVEAEDRGESDAALCHWRNLFGDAFPAPAGGCDNDEDEKYENIAVNVGSGAAAVGEIGRERSRPVKDSPQGA